MRTLILAALLTSALLATTARAITPPPIDAPCPAAAPARQEVRDLTDDQWTHYITAVKTLQSRATPETASMYDQLAYLHHQYADRIHGVAAFFPWHRLFLRTFEYDLQQIDPTVAVPYWDWTRDSNRLAGAPFWSANLLGGDGSGGSPDVVTDGQFAGWVPFYSAHGFRKGGRTFGLIRQWEDPSGLGTGYAAARVNAIMRKARTYDQFRRAIERVHGQVHFQIGGKNGDMNDIEFSPNDPVFWMHHAFIDKLWTDWQRKHPNAYGGAKPNRRTGAALTDKLDGFAGVRVRDVMDNTKLCVKYDTAVPQQPTTTTLRTSSATIKPREDVTFIATISRAVPTGTVDFRQAQGPSLCRNVAPVFAVNTWTAVCKANARQLGGRAGASQVVASYSGDRDNAASAGTATQRIVRAQATVLWTPAESVVYGTELAENVKAFSTAPGSFSFTVLDEGSPPALVDAGTVLSAGYHVLLLRYTPASGPAQTLTRSFVVRPGTLYVRPESKRITTADPTPPLTFVVDGFIGSDSAATVLTGFGEPICHASRPDGLSETDPRPAGTYTIFCGGGSALNYTIDTTQTATLDVVTPDDPLAGQPIPPLPVGGLGAGPPRHRPSICSSFLARGAVRLYCGGIKHRRSGPIVIVRKGRVVSRGRARRAGKLLELSTARRVPPGRYRVRLRARRLKIRVIPEAKAKRASTEFPRTNRSLAELCRLHDVNVFLGTHVRGGISVGRWRVVQKPL